MIAAHHRDEVDLENPAPFLKRNILGETDADRRSIVHDDVDPAEALHRQVAHPLVGIDFGDIARERRRSAARRRDFGCDSIEPIGSVVTVVEPKRGDDAPPPEGPP